MRIHCFFQFQALLFMALFFVGCDASKEQLPYAADADSQGHTAATEHTRKVNEQVLNALPFTDQQDFEDARRGLIASDTRLQVNTENGTTIWDMPAYDFIQTRTPDSVNPSLWRQAQLNNLHGLFKVTEGVYQLRGFDLANMTIIEGQTGWILVDPLTTAETAKQALDFARLHLGEKPIRAVIFTHSHIDHFGGVLGVLPESGERSVRIIAPEGFLEESVSENVLAGPTMTRRSDFMYGRRLARSVRGHVDTGLGKGPAFGGSVGIFPPTEIIDKTLQKKEIDGIQFIFQVVSGSEAPAELTFYLPHVKAFCGAELLSRNMHNLYTLRGAKVRDALAWSGFINEAKTLFADAQIYFASHHWPIWGTQRIANFLEKQRDTYKYIHDQTLRLAYHGFTPSEIAEQLELPESLGNAFSNRGYYGTVRHNSRAVYQGYFGWYDGNPANLNPLPPTDSAKRYVAVMGGSQKVMSAAQGSFDNGEYRWVAQLLNHLVFAEPSNKSARALLAKAYDQLGYQAESGPWRDVYLSGAFELRNGPPEDGIDLSTARDMVKHTPLANFFNVMAAQLNAQKARGEQLVINITFTDLNETHTLTLKNSVLNHRQGEPDPIANATLNVTHDLFLDMALDTINIKDIIFSDQLSIDGSKLDLLKFFSLQDKSDGNFNIVIP